MSVPQRPAARRAPNPPLRVRLARRADLAQLVGLMRAAMAAERALSPDLVSRGFDAHASRRAFARDLRGARARWWVVQDGSRLVAMVAADLKLARHRHAPVRRRIMLHSMFVAPRVRRCGLGRALMRHALAWAQRQRATLVLLETAAANRGAQRLYERAGFVRRELLYSRALPTR